MASLYDKENLKVYPVCRLTKALCHGQTLESLLLVQVEAILVPSGLTGRHLAVRPFPELLRRESGAVEQPLASLVLLAKADRPFPVRAVRSDPREGEHARGRNREARAAKFEAGLAESDTVQGALLRSFLRSGCEAGHVVDLARKLRLTSQATAIFDPVPTHPLLVPRHDMAVNFVRRSDRDLLVETPRRRGERRPDTLAKRGSDQLEEVPEARSVGDFGVRRVGHAVVPFRVAVRGLSREVDKARLGKRTACCSRHLRTTHGPL